MADKIFYKRGFTIPGASQFESERGELGFESEVEEGETLAAAMHRIRVFVHGELEMQRAMLVNQARHKAEKAKAATPAAPRETPAPPQRRWAADDEPIDSEATFVGDEDQWRALERLVEATGRRLTPKWRGGIMRWHSGRKSLAAVEKSIRDTLKKMDAEDGGNRAH